MFPRHTSRKQLAAIGLNQIEKYFLGQFAMSGRASGQEKQRVFLADRVRFLDFTEQFASILELRLELWAQFGANVVTATVNARTYGGSDVAGRCAKTTIHLANALFYDTFQRPAPACMKNSNRFPLCVHKNYRQAIGREDPQQNAWDLRDQTVAWECGPRWCLIDTTNQIRVNLTHSHDWPGASLTDGSNLTREILPGSVRRQRASPV